MKSLCGKYCRGRRAGLRDVVNPVAAWLNACVTNAPIARSNGNGLFLYCAKMCPLFSCVLHAVKNARLRSISQRF